MSSSSDDEVIFSTVNNCGVITLNRPKALNALNLPMAKSIYAQLSEWNKSKLGLVIIEGTGEKAFCAGGDIRAITDSRGAEDQTEFFRCEYLLNNLIGTLRVPYVALLDGITMGGGVGLSVHGRYRVATERTLFAMPETGIGLIPDVGGSFFLPRLSGQLGMYLALTGHRLKGLDCLHAGVATHACHGAKVSQLKTELIHCNGDEQLIRGVLASFTKELPADKFSLADKLPAIDSIFSGDSLEAVLSSLETANGEWEKKTLQTIGRMSPTSLKVTFRQLREGRRLSSLAECLRMEFRLVTRCCEDNDFYEGVRALLVDRDNAPKWKPASVTEVTSQKVDHYFSLLPPEKEIHF
jgi:3-hydroxyisobutyryl-CoA hydrolase